MYFSGISSWSEMAKYDMLAMINGVLKWTNRSHLYYVGHSQGTLTMFTKLSEDEHLNKKVCKFDKFHENF